LISPLKISGAAGYIDRLVLKPWHMYHDPSLKYVYQTVVPFDPEGNLVLFSEKLCNFFLGIMGILTGILLCYLGVQAGHSFVHSTRVRRVCTHWMVFGIICGSLGLVLSKGAQSDSWIPINKNMCSLTFVLILASLAYFILTILYLVVDVYKWFTGEPFLWPGMNSIAIFIAHGFFATFPARFEVDRTHPKLLAMNLYGSFYWTIVAGWMYHKKIFITI
jgi:heparan-alpha-glucosaminide N-acetyltransferase